MRCTYIDGATREKIDPRRLPARQSRDRSTNCQRIGTAWSKSRNTAQPLRGLGKQASVLGVFLDDMLGLGDLHCVMSTK
jgi:hypothetical protein